MGECAYYLKAEFPTAKIANKVANELTKLFAESFDFCQELEAKSGKDRRTFWQNVEKKYPHMTAYLKEEGLWRKEANVLSGNIEFTSDPNNEPNVSDTVVEWSDACIWHFSDWSRLCEFIKKKYGAIKVVWDQEENGCGGLDGLNLYDWEAIVRGLLKNKALWPMLLNVHPDLTLLLEAHMKK